MMNLKATDIGLKAAEGKESAEDESAEALRWVREIEDARKREKEFRKEGVRVVSLYEGEKKEEYQYNILYSNTETMLPALYNSTPRPIVKRRFITDDPLGKMASTAAERVLEYLSDDGNARYTSFDDLIKSATLEALLPGRGVTRFKYDAEMTEAAEGQPAVMGSETVCGEEVPWDRFFHGSAKKWKDVPWIAFEHFMTREELVRNFAEVGKEVEVTELTSDDGDGSDGDPSRKESVKDTAGLKVAQVFEIWDKEEREVLFVSPQYKKGVLKEVPDPLKLTGFFPMPRPMSFIAKVSTLTPVSPYTMYEAQAKELNRITIRINRLIAALKVRGLYDSTIEGIDKVLKADDNILVPAENVAALLSQGNALEKAIWLMPIEKLVSVLQQLYVQRDQVKTVIYEITGIADIMRGSSQASETLGAQQLKNQWGTLRLKKTQKEVMRYARDCLRIMTEIAVSKFSPETMRGMTGLPYPTGSEKQQAQAQAQLLQAQVMQQAQLAQAQGQQPQPPQIPPELQQALSLPTWEEILELLRDDTQRNFRIDIETNSTVDAEATEDKQDMGEVMNAISQFLSGIGPLVENGTMPFEVAQGMLLAVVRRYRFGSEMEDSLMKMKAPNAGPNAEQIKQQQKELQKQSDGLKQQQEALQKEQFAAQQQLAQKQAADALQLQAQQAQIEQQLQARQRQADVAMQQQELDLAAAKREAEQALELERRQMEHEKALALQEIEFAKQQALKELDMAQQEKQAQTDHYIRTKEHGLQLKQAAHQETVARSAETAKAKQTESTASAGNEALVQGLEKVGASIVDGLAKAKPRTARKQPDGSWTAE